MCFTDMKIKIKLGDKIIKIKANRFSLGHMNLKKYI